MSPEQVTTDRIDLHYTLTRDDLVDGLAAQRNGRRTWLVATVYPLIGLAIGLVYSQAWEIGVAIVVAISVGVLLFGAGFSVLVHRLASALVRRWTARMIIRGNPWMSQPAQVTVTHTGIHLRTVTGESSTNWPHHPVYVETGRSFIVLASKGMGAGLLVLPKRGLIDAQPEQLRAMLDAHAHRRGDGESETAKNHFQK